MEEEKKAPPEDAQKTEERDHSHDGREIVAMPAHGAAAAMDGWVEITLSHPRFGLQRYLLSAKNAQTLASAINLATTTKGPAAVDLPPKDSTRWN